MDLTLHQSNAFLGAGLLLEILLERRGLASPRAGSEPVAPTQQQVRVVRLIMRMRAVKFTYYYNYCVLPILFRFVFILILHSNSLLTESESETACACAYESTNKFKVGKKSKCISNGI